MAPLLFWSLCLKFFVKLQTETKKYVNCVLIWDSCCLHNKPRTESFQSSEVEGSAQQGSEHPNWHLLASSFFGTLQDMFSSLALCAEICSSSVNSSFYSDTRAKEKKRIVHRVETFLFNDSVYTYRRIDAEECTIKMFTQDVYTTSPDLYVWWSTLIFNHVFKTISIGREQNENTVLHKSRLCPPASRASADWHPSHNRHRSGGWNNYCIVRKRVVQSSKYALIQSSRRSSSLMRDGRCEVCCV